MTCSYTGAFINPGRCRNNHRADIYLRFYFVSFLCRSEQTTLNPRGPHEVLLVWSSSWWSQLRTLTRGWHPAEVGHMLTLQQEVGVALTSCLMRDFCGKWASVLLVLQFYPTDQKRQITVLNVRFSASVTYWRLAQDPTCLSIEPSLCGLSPLMTLDEIKEV